MAIQRLNSLDGNENIRSELERPDRYRHLFESLSKPGKVIARGSALSYCNASAGENTTSVSSLLFNRILSFNRQSGTISLEPGVRIGELIRFAMSHNLHIPVAPGHPAITVGGCVAFNVHGKSQYKNGNFIEYVERLKLFHPDHGEVTCSREENPDLFYLTVGGFGLTGFITQIDLRLLPLEYQSVVRERHKTKNLQDAVEQMTALSSSCDAIYSWNNLNRTGDRFGQGIIYAERFSNQKVKSSKKPDTYEVHRLPGRGLNFYNHLTNMLICRAYELYETLKSKPESVSFEDAIFPLYGHEIYFSLFGSKGFREYSMLFSKDVWPEVHKELKSITHKAGVPVTLSALKLYRGKQTLLNYCGEGVGINIDVPATRKSVDYFKALDALVVRYKGYANLSKDSRITYPTVREIFPEYDIFKEKLLKFDPGKIFNSALRQRLDV